MANNRPGTSTQIRNFYAEGMSCLNMKFYNTNLSIQLYPFTGKNENGRSQYDTKAGLMTTVDYTAAAALYQVSKDIVDGKIQECEILIPCASDASIKLERKNMGTVYETILSINKNGQTIPFKFATNVYQVTTNGQRVNQVVESALLAFNSTIRGYLEGINSDRHLDKMTDEFIKSGGNNSNNQYGNNQNNNQYGGGNNNCGNFNGGNYNNNRGGKGNYNNNRNYNNNNYNGNRNNGNNNNYGNNQQPNWGENQQQLSTYEIQN